MMLGLRYTRGIYGEGVSFYAWCWRFKSSLWSRNLLYYV